jgi:hypothetical protein
MNLSKKELLKKFPELEKFKDQKWMEEESIKHDCNYKELPLKAAFFMIKELKEFCKSYKFTSNWEKGFSIEKRLKQLEKLLQHFCNDTEEEKALKGIDINIQHPID